VGQCGHHVLLLQRRVVLECHLLHPVRLNGVDLSLHHAPQRELEARQLLAERVGVVAAEPLVRREDHAVLEGRFVAH